MDKMLDELMKLVEEEPEEMSLDEMAERHFIRLFEEPEHSRGVIMGFQRKYGVHSVDIINEDYRMVNCITISEKDLAAWQWAIEMFTKAGGSIFDLPFSDSDPWITKADIGTSTGASKERGRRSVSPAFVHDLILVSA